MNKFKQGILLCSSFVLLLGLFSTSFSIAFLSNNAGAVAPWNSAIRTTQQLTVIDNSGNVNINVTDIEGDSFYTTAVINSPNDTCSTQQKADFTEAFNKGSILTSQVRIDANSNQYGQMYVVMWYSTTKNQPLNAQLADWTSPQHGDQELMYYPTGYQSTVVYYHPSLQRVIGWCGKAGNDPVNFPSTSGKTGTDMGNQESWIYQNSFNTTYPDGYTGIVPSDNPVALSPIYPDVKWTLDADRNLLVNYSGDKEFTIEGNLAGQRIKPKITYTVQYIEAGEQTETETPVTMTLNDTYSVQLPHNGNWRLYAQYTHPGVPYAPFKDGLPLKTVQFLLNANGVPSQGGTAEQECIATQYGTIDCGESSPYEDCTTYGVDLVGGFQCVISNFGIWMKLTTISLFVPNTRYLNEQFTEFGDRFREQLGFLTYPFDLIASLTTKVNNALSGESGNGACNVGGGKLFGADFNVDMCYFRTLEMWAWIQPIIIGLTSLGLVGAFFREYQAKVKGKD